MRVAVLHDHLSFIGGGERVAMTLSAAFDADLYVTDLDPAIPARAGMPHVRAFELARVPRKAPMRQDAQIKAFREAAITDHDIYVLSGNWAVFAAPRLRPNVWYCHTPVRVFYDLKETFLRSFGVPQRWVARRWIRRRKAAYEAATRSVEHILANSRNVSARIERYLHRESTVAYPPVDTARYRFVRHGDFWLSVNRLSHEKRIGLQLEAFRRLPDERLIVAGGPSSGEQIDRTVRSFHAPPNVEFLGEVDDVKLLDLYGTCRGLVATAIDEDFGLGPVEAMASGKPVVAVNEGGYQETVIDAKTGWLVPAAVDAVAATISRASDGILNEMRPACETRAREFDVKRFLAQMRTVLESTARGPTTAKEKGSSFRPR